MATPRFQLQIPVDVSGIEDVKPGQQVRVVAQDAQGKVRSATVALDARGQGTAALEFGENPGKLRIVLGPENIAAEDLLGMQTVETTVPARALTPARPLRLPALRISPVLWDRWWRWCRTFTVTGRLLCANGQPVPGAKVCAYDVDFWWWWKSKQLVKCATTDADGNFTLKFKWCCGFQPGWWWSRRIWQLDPILADHIVPLLHSLPRPLRVVPQAKPSLAVFSELLGGGGAAASRGIDPSALASLRDRLVRERKLPAAPRLEKWRLWPWFPWQPWFDCNPDLVFEVSQSCQGLDTVIVSESIDDVRWDVPTTFDVTLVANGQACCLPTDDHQPEGTCALLTEVCGVTLDHIGGNLGALPAPAGYVNPTTGDQPFGGPVLIEGEMGDAVDYYAFEWSDDGGGSWNAMPAPAAGGFSRVIFTPLTTFTPVPFAFEILDGRLVMETRLHYQTANPFAGFWTATHYHTLMNWLTEGNFSDGTYQLRVKGYKRVGDTLTDETILPVCTTETEAGLVLRIDNRFVGGASGHPTAPDHPCGAGTVHTCTTEPDTDFVSVRINGTEVGACDVVNAQAGGTLEIDFLAHDPDGHLGSYSLIATYGENLAVDLLGVPGATLSSAPAVSGVPSAAQVGPTYSAARAQGAASPVWAGGVIRLTIPDLKKAFPKTCCYQLELRAYKRTLVGCAYTYDNLSEYSFMVMV